MELKELILPIFGGIIGAWIAKELLGFGIQLKTKKPETIWVYGPEEPHVVLSQEAGTEKPGVGLQPIGPWIHPKESPVYLSRTYIPAPWEQILEHTYYR